MALAPTPLPRLASSYAFHSTSSLSNSSTPAANAAAAKDTGAHASPSDAPNCSLVDELRHPWPTILNRWQSESHSLLIGLSHKHWHSTVLVSLALFLLILAARLALRGPGGLRCRRVESRRALDVASDGTAASQLCGSVRRERTEPHTPRLIELTVTPFKDRGHSLESGERVRARSRGSRGDGAVAVQGAKPPARSACASRSSVARMVVELGSSGDEGDEDSEESKFDDSHWI